MGEDRYSESLTPKIKESLDKFDTSLNIRTPDMGYFRNIVAAVEKKKKERRRKETIVFIILAVIVPTMEAFIFSQSMLLFVAVQAVALLSIPAVFFSRFRHKSGQEGVQ